MVDAIDRAPLLVTREPRALLPKNVEAAMR